MVTITTTPERGEIIKQIVENALTFAVLTNRGVFASVGMTLLGFEVTDEERDAILRQVDESLSEVNYARQQKLEIYTPLVNEVREWVGSGKYSIPVCELEEYVYELQEWEEERESPAA